MAEYFHLDDAGFLDWLEEHRSGYVFNYFGGNDANYNKLHKASCYSLFSGQQGKRTTVRKVCSDSLTELKKTATELRGGSGDWTLCRKCLK